VLVEILAQSVAELEPSKEEVSSGKKGFGGKFCSFAKRQAQQRRD
jgi:hypothetical protein